MIKNIFNE